MSAWQNVKSGLQFGRGDSRALFGSREDCPHRLRIPPLKSGTLQGNGRMTSKFFLPTEAFIRSHD